MQLKARNEPKAKEVQLVYQQPAEISDNIIRVGDTNWRTTKQFSPRRDWKKKSTPEELGFQNLEKYLGSNLHYVGPTGHQEKEKIHQ